MAGLIIFPVILQTVINLIMLSIGGRGAVGCLKFNKLHSVHVSCVKFRSVKFKCSESVIIFVITVNDSDNDGNASITICRISRNSLAAAAVTFGSLPVSQLLERPASLQVWQMCTSLTVEWHHTPLSIWDDPDAVADFVKLDDNWRRGAVGCNNKQQQ